MKTRLILLATLSILAALFFTGAVFAEGEVPQSPAAEVPEGPAAEEPPAPPEEAPKAVEEAVMKESAPPPVESAPASEEPAGPAPAQPAEGDVPAEPVAVDTEVQQEVPIIETAFVEETLPEAEAPAEELPAVEETSVVEEAPANEEPVTTELAPETVNPVLEAEDTLPESEELPIIFEEPILVNADGEPLVLASEESADLLKAPDPYFYIAGIPYQFTTLDCDPGISGNQPCTNPLLAAINYIDTNSLVPDGGALYVEKATYTGNVVIDYIAKPNLSSLTGLVGIQSGGLSPTISGSLTLNNLLSGFSLTNFNITGGVFINNSDGQFYIDNVSAPLSMTDVDASSTSSHGIAVYNHKGNATLTRVTANNNNEIGIFILNHAGNIFFDTVTANDNGANGAAIFNDTGIYNITIKNSEFNHNGLNEGISGSLSIWSNGMVTLNGVIANDNNDTFGGSGIRVRSGGASLRNVIANNNAGNGIHVQLRSGSILLENAVASNNGSDGVNVELRDKDGNEIFYPANVTIKNLVANDNNFNGLLLKTLGTVTITNSQTNNSVNNNGLSIATSGKVTLNSIRSSNNNENGVLIRGIEITESGAPGITGMASPTSITITSPANAAQSNVFDDNGEFGIYIVTDKLVTISNFSASDNTGNGILVKGYNYYFWDPIGSTWVSAKKYAGATTITATIPNYTNKVSENDNTGIRIDSSGTVKLERTIANGNDFRGIEINTLGSITVSNVKALANSEEAIKLFNKDASSAMPVTVTNIETSDTIGIKGRGLDIESRGAVKVTNLKALNNSELGLNINNCAGGLGIAGITLTNLTVNENEGAGIELFSNGVVNLKNVTANDNGGNGVMVENESDTKAGIIMTNVRADGNNGDGFSLYTTWGVVVKDASASGNAKTTGSIRYDSSSGHFIGVQDYFNSNLGLDRWNFIAGPGSSTTVRMEAGGKDPGDNLLFADDLIPHLELYDNAGTLIPTSPSCGTNSGRNYCEFTFSSTDGEAYYVLVGSSGSDGFYRVSVNDSDPFDHDADLYWDFGLDFSSTNSVAVSGTNTFNNNSMSGLQMWVDGTGASNISVSNVTANGNGVSGMVLYNIMGTGNVTISGNNELQNNGWGGLYVGTNGTASVSNLDASFNGQTEDDDGVAIEAGGLNKAVTLTHVTALENSVFGVNITANGSINLSNIRANANDQSGIHLENCVSGMGGCTGSGNVLMSGFNEANYNNTNGLDIITAGTITLSNLEASANNGMGVDILANGLNKAVTLNYVNTMENDESGIRAKTNGLITLNNVKAWLNLTDGAVLDSNGYSIVVKFSSFMANDRWGLAYQDYNPVTYPLFHFTNLSNVLLGNGVQDLYVHP